MPVYYPRARVIIQPLFDDFKRSPLGGGDSLAEAGLSSSAREGSIHAVPRTVEWESSEPGTAASGRLTLYMDSLPVDPRAIRDARVIVFADNVASPADDVNDADQRQARFIGFIDESGLDFRDERTVRVEFRDYAGRLIDTDWYSGSVPVDISLTASIRKVLEQLPFYARLPITVDDDRPAGSYSGRTRYVPPTSANMWDVVQGIARMAGMVADFDLDTLRIRRPQPATSERSTVLLYGKNVVSAEMSRNYNPTTRKAIELIATDPKRRRVTRARWPKARRDKETLVSFPIVGSWSASDLEQQAKSVWLQQDRQQFKLVVDTVDMTDLSEAERPMLDLVAGDPITFGVRSDERTQVLGMSRSELGNYLVDVAGLTERAAWALATAWVEADDLAALFYAQRVSHRIDEKAGYSATITAGAVIGVEG